MRFSTLEDAVAIPAGVVVESASTAVGGADLVIAMSAFNSFVASSHLLLIRFDNTELFRTYKA